MTESNPKTLRVCLRDPIPEIAEAHVIWTKRCRLISLARVHRDARNGATCLRQTTAGKQGRIPTRNQRILNGVE